MTAPAFYTLTDTGARLVLRVTPNASVTRIEGVETRADGSCALKIRVTAPPDKGAANAAIIALLSKTLRLPGSALAIVAGETARTKTLALTAPKDLLVPALDALAAPR